MFSQKRKIQPLPENSAWLSKLSCHLIGTASAFFSHFRLERTCGQSPRIGFIFLQDDLTFRKGQEALFLSFASSARFQEFMPRTYLQRLVENLVLIKVDSIYIIAES